jgi:hypothetical protein
MDDQFKPKINTLSKDGAQLTPETKAHRQTGDFPASFFNSRVRCKDCTKNK